MYVLYVDLIINWFVYLYTNLYYVSKILLTTNVNYYSSYRLIEWLVKYIPILHIPRKNAIIFYDNSELD